jgi:hypothetical protein
MTPGVVGVAVPDEGIYLDTAADLTIRERT